tara:strand:- start:10 stop:264 length:255 start_codon:yes stop_codon:yes gene_type:complete
MRVTMITSPLRGITLTVSLAIALAAVQTWRQAGMAAAVGGDAACCRSVANDATLQKQETGARLQDHERQQREHSACSHACISPP